MWVAGQIQVVEAGFGDWVGALKAFLETGKQAALLVFSGDPKKYVERLKAEEHEVVVFRSKRSVSGFMDALYKYVYGLGGQPVFPCLAILLSRRVAELALTSGGRGLTPLIKAIRTFEENPKGVKYVVVEDSGAEARFPLTLFLAQVVLPGLLESSLLRFMLVGASGVLVNLGVLDLQVRLLSLRSAPYLAVPLAFEASVAWNFILNNHFTFRARDIGKLRFIEYNASTLGSFLVQLAAVYILTTHAHTYYLLASLVGIILGFFVNYTISLWIWRSPTPKPKLRRHASGGGQPYPQP